MNNITKDTLTYTAPQTLLDGLETRPMVTTTTDALAALAANTGLPTLYARLDELPEDLLDILAADFKVDWYDYDAPLDEKRATMKSAIFVHRHLGTPSAVQRVIDDVFGDGRVEEWYNYEREPGQPYHFRVHTSNTSVLLANRAKFLRLIEHAKNVRSIFDNVIYDGVTDVNAKAGAAVRCIVGSAKMAVPKHRGG